MKQLSVLIFLTLVLCGCGNRSVSVPATEPEEDRDAKAMLQGFWVDDETEEYAVHVEGDTVFYSDSTSMPAYFRIVNDSLVLASGAAYNIEGTRHPAHHDLHPSGEDRLGGQLWR